MHLDRCFISMETALFQEHLMHPSIDGASHSLEAMMIQLARLASGKGQADAFPFAFLAVQWQGIAIFLHHDMGDHRW